MACARQSSCKCGCAAAQCHFCSQWASSKGASGSTCVSSCSLRRGVRHNVDRHGQADGSISRPCQISLFQHLMRAMVLESAAAGSPLVYPRDFSLPPWPSLLVPGPQHCAVIQRRLCRIIALLVHSDGRTAAYRAAQAGHGSTHRTRRPVRAQDGDGRCCEISQRHFCGHLRCATAPRDAHCSQPATTLCGCRSPARHRSTPHHHLTVTSPSRRRWHRSHSRWTPV